MDKINVVLDLDNTLINSFDETDELFKLIHDGDTELNYLSQYCYHLSITCSGLDLEQYKLWGIFRPYLVEFILYCAERCKNIYIWSAGHRDYVEAVVEKIFGNLDYKPKLIFSIEETEYDEGSGVVIKDLNKLYQASSGQALAHNTIIIDDRRDALSRNHDNGILIPRFAFRGHSVNNSGREATINQITSDIRKDRALQELIKWMDNIKDIPDVRLLDKTNIFSDKENFDEMITVSPSVNVNKRARKQTNNH